MSDATDAFDRWTNDYWRLLAIPISTDVSAEKLRTQLTLHLGSLRSILEKIAAECERHSIDSTPVWKVSGGIPHLHNNRQNFDESMDNVWTIVRRLNAIEGALMVNHAAKSNAEPTDFQISMREDNSDRTLGELIELISGIESARQSIESTKSKLGFEGFRAIKWEHERKEIEQLPKQLELEKAALEALLADLPKWPNVGRLQALCESEGGRLSVDWLRQWRAKRAVETNTDSVSEIDKIRLSKLFTASSTIDDKDSKEVTSTSATADRADDGTDAQDDALPIADRKLRPSRLKAQAAYEWAMTDIPNAEKMTLNELHDAICLHGKGLENMIPDRPDTFSRYLREAGIKRYDTTGKPKETRSVRKR